MQPFALPVGFFIEILMLALLQWGLEALGKKAVLTTHSAGKAHTEAMVSWQEYQIRTRTGQSIGVQLDNIGSQIICQNRKYVVALMEGILYCSQQGIALRGHNESDDSLNYGNFKSLMVLLSRHSQGVSRHFQDYSRSATWLSPSFQNEIIQFLADQVQTIIKKQIQKAKYFTVLADETKDISKREQLAIVFRYIHNFKIVERFTGYTLATALNSRALTDYIIKKVSDIELDPRYLISQCYDGASVMSGCNLGVQTLIKEICPQATYVHCCAHRLNLILVDVAKHVKAASNLFAHLQTLYIFFSAPKCHELFLSIQKAEGGKEIRLKIPARYKRGVGCPEGSDA